MPLSHRVRADLVKFIHQHHLKIKVSEGWENFSQNLKQPHALVLDIEDIASLQAVVKEIYRYNNEPHEDTHKQIDPKDRITYRVAAGGRDVSYSHSYSLTPGSEADIVFRCVGHEFRLVNPTDKPLIMEVGASLQIGELHDELYKRKMVLPTASLIKYPTVAGLAANAGHGTGKDQPSFAGLFSSMTFMLPNGEIITIDENDKDFATLCSGHLGLPGIMLSGKLRCAVAKKLRCNIEVRSLSDFIDEVRKGLFLKDEYTSVMYVPTYSKNEFLEKNIIIYRFEPVSMDTPNVDYHPANNHIIQHLEVALEEGFKITELLAMVPEIIPDYMRYLVAKGAIGEKDRLVIGDWPAVYHYQTEYPHDLNDIDVLFPVSNDLHEIVAAFTKLATMLQDCARKGEYPVTFAAYARFISGTNGGMSTSAHKDGKHVCGFDIVSSPGLRGFEPFRDEMFKFLVEKLDGKPHWGKYAPPDYDYQHLYGDEFQKFIVAITALYDKHKMDFTRSPLLNNFCARILGMPQFAPRQAETIEYCERGKCVQRNVSEMARVALPLISGDYQEAHNLRKRFHAISKQKENVAANALFAHKTQHDDASVHLERKKKEKEKSNCCVLL